MLMLSVGEGSCRGVNECRRAETVELLHDFYFLWFCRNTDVKMPSHHNNDFMLMRSADVSEDFSLCSGVCGNRACPRPAAASTF